MPSQGPGSRELLNDGDVSFVTSTALGLEDESSFLSMTSGSNPKHPFKANIRRPLGCAVLDLSEVLEMSKSDSNAPPLERTVNVFIPTSEPAFSTLHEDIIASRVKNFEKSPRVETVTVKLKLYKGPKGADLVNLYPSILEGVAFTQRLGFSDVVEPGMVRNDVFVKLWSGEFNLGTISGEGSVGFSKLAAAASSPKNIEVASK